MEVMKIELNKAIEYIDKAQTKLSEWRSKVALGNRYYNNEDDIKRTGAAAIDAVNGYLQGIGPVSYTHLIPATSATRWRSQTP